MINGIQGKPGGGKSYEAVVNHIIPTVTKDKRKIITNLPLNIDHFCNVFGEYCRDLIEVIDGQFHNYGNERPFSKKDHYLQYENWQNEQGQKVYFYIDECHLAMPSTGTEKELTEFFSMHRHYGFDIMLITQNFRKVNRDVRDMVQLSYRCIKKSHMGQDDKYILKVHDGVGTTNSSVINTHEREYEQRFFPFYTSHTKSAKSVLEATTKDIKKWYNNWTTWGALSMIPLGLLVVIGAFSSSPDTVELAKDAQSNTSSQIKSSIVEPKETLKQNITPSESNTSKNEANTPSTDNTKKHPFYKVDLHISGWATYTERGKITKNYYFSASQNGQHIFEISLRDLILSGYTVLVRSGCMVEIKFSGYHDYITCDMPSMEVFEDEDTELVE